MNNLRKGKNKKRNANVLLEVWLAILHSKDRNREFVETADLPTTISCPPIRVPAETVKQEERQNLLHSVDRNQYPDGIGRICSPLMTIEMPLEEETRKRRKRDGHE
jgi:hypothetical protein